MMIGIGTPRSQSRIPRPTLPSSCCFGPNREPSMNFEAPQFVPNEKHICAFAPPAISLSHRPRRPNLPRPCLTRRLRRPSLGRRLRRPNLPRPCLTRRPRRPSLSRRQGLPHRPPRSSDGLRAALCPFRPNLSRCPRLRLGPRRRHSGWRWPDRRLSLHVVLRCD